MHKHYSIIINKAHLREFFTDFDLSITLRSCSSTYRCQDLAILVMTIDRQNRLLYPLHCVNLQNAQIYYLKSWGFLDDQTQERNAEERKDRI